MEAWVAKRKAVPATATAASASKQAEVAALAEATATLPAAATAPARALGSSVLPIRRMFPISYYTVQYSSKEKKYIFGAVNKIVKYICASPETMHKSLMFLPPGMKRN
jgi:hypothetical protein